MNQCELANQSALEASDQTLADEKSFALQAKALSHPARVRILKILHTLDELGGCLNNDLVSQLGLAQSTVSEHLRILRQAGFITAEAQPPKMCYQLNRAQTDQFRQLFNALFK